MGKLYNYLPILFFLLFTEVSAQISDERVTSASSISATVNNLGLIGNAFRGSYTQLGYPSCQFPAGSGIEHLVQGGLWVGAFKQGTPAVTTGALLLSGNGSSNGYIAGVPGFEFSAPVGSRIQVRSSLTRSPVYDPRAVSHQDYVTTFTDKNIFVPGSGNPPLEIRQHTNPLGIDGKLELYNWNLPFSNFFLVLNYEIVNGSDEVWDSVFVGWWGDGNVRNVNIVRPTGTQFFNQGGNGYIDSLILGYEFDATGEPGFTDSYYSLKFLGSEFFSSDIERSGFYHPYTTDSTFRVKNPNFKANFHSWLFTAADPRLFPPENDPERYSRMSAGLNFDSEWESRFRQGIKLPANRSNLISVGPYRKVFPGDTIRAAFAIVVAKKFEDGLPNGDDTDKQKETLIKNAIWAQTTYNGNDRNFNGILDEDEDDGSGKINRFILPSPPDVPETRVVSRSNQIDLFWSRNAEFSIDPISKQRDFEGYRIYKSKFAFDIAQTIDLEKSLELLASFDSAGNGLFYDNGFSKIRLEADTFFAGDPTPYRYKFTIKNVANGWQNVVGVTAFDRGDAVNNVASLETAVRANLFNTFAGTPGNADMAANEPFVYPNPYYSDAAWEGSSTRAEDKKLYFANLPKNCEVRIFTAAGDIVDDFVHNADTYQGDVGWFTRYSRFSPDPTEAERRVFSGGEHAWDLLSKYTQIISRGLYMFSVKDLDSGKTFRGKFVIIK